MAYVGAARIAENGTVNGKRGDQTGNEVSIKPAYMHRNGWQIIRAKDVNIANDLAWLMKVACMSDEVGYSQSDRYYIFFTGIQKNVPTNCDCSSLVAWCVQQAGIKNFEVNGFYTGNEISRLVGTGQFDVFPCNSISDMYTGDILVDAKGTAHTEIVTDGKTRLSGNYFDEPEPTLKYGSQGSEVLKLQKFYNQFANWGLDEDGDFGENTKNAVKFMQSFWKLKIDGIYGEKSHGVVCFILWAKGVQIV